MKMLLWGIVLTVVVVLMIFFWPPSSEIEVSLSKKGINTEQKPIIAMPKMHQTMPKRDPMVELKQATPETPQHTKQAAEALVMSFIPDVRERVSLECQQQDMDERVACATKVANKVIAEKRLALQSLAQ